MDIEFPIFNLGGVTCSELILNINVKIIKVNFGRGCNCFVLIYICE